MDDELELSATHIATGNYAVIPSSPRPVEIAKCGPVDSKLHQIQSKEELIKMNYLTKNSN